MRYSFVALNHPATPYQAFDPADLAWAIFSYFSWHKYPTTPEGLMEALATLAEISGRQPEPGSLLPWPLTTYQGLGLKNIKLVLQEEQRVQKLEVGEVQEPPQVSYTERGKGMMLMLLKCEGCHQAEQEH